MSAMALNTSFAPPPSGSEVARTAPSAPPSSDLSFASVLGEIDAPEAVSTANGSNSDESSISKDSPTRREGVSEDADAANDPFSIEAGLAALGYGSFDGSARAVSFGGDSRGATPSAPAAKAEAASSSSARSGSRPGLGISGFGGAAAPNARRLAATSAPIAGSAIPANSSDAVSAAAVFNPLTADPSLGLRSLQSRTHLAMTNAVPVRAGAPERRASGSAGASVATVQAASAKSAAMNADSGDGEPAERRSGAPASFSSSRAGAVASPAPNPSLAVTGAALDPKSSALASVPLNRLADVVAEQASSLVSRDTPSTGSPASSAAAPGAVKELEISLDPANLGAVSVKMRLANGKLSVVIGVSSSSTLEAIENERGAISARLGSSEQPLESLVIRSQETTGDSPGDSAQTHSGGNDASDSGNSPHARSNDHSAGARRGEGGFARGQNDPPAPNGSPGWTPSVSGGRPGAVLV
jgi:flagellar hook-length control protein FliK